MRAKRAYPDAPWRPPKTRRPSVAPQDGTDLAMVTYLWGSKVSVLVDTLVLGKSLQESGTNAAMIVCVCPDAEKALDTQLLAAFWEIRAIKHIDVPMHLQRTEMSRLTGVYIKLSVWIEFADDKKRVLMLDSDMLVRRNIDEIFGNKTPVAVMRGEADSCMHTPRPKSSYFEYGRNPGKYSEHGEKMKGGINGCIK